MTDETGRIMKKLADLDTYSTRLIEIRQKDGKHYEKADNTIKAATERNLQLISDTEIDILALLNGHLKLGVAGDDISIIDKFENRVKGAVIERLRKRRKLRNMIIHAYVTKTYDNEIYAQASDLTDVGDFSSEIRKLLAR